MVLRTITALTISSAPELFRPIAASSCECRSCLMFQVEQFCNGFEGMVPLSCLVKQQNPL